MTDVEFGAERQVSRVTDTNAADILAQARRIEQKQMLDRQREELAEERETLARRERHEEALTAVLDDRAIEYGKAVLVKRWQLLSGLQDAAVRFTQAHKSAEAQRNRVDLLERAIASTEERLERSTS